MMDPKIILVALSGLENILRTGEAIVKEYGGQNVYAIQVEECFGKCYNPIVKEFNLTTTVIYGNVPFP